MIFTLVSSAQEWLNTKWDEIRKRREEYAILKEKEAEEAERVCYFMSFTLHFIPCTNIPFLNQACMASCESMSPVEHESPPTPPPYLRFSLVLDLFSLLGKSLFL